MKYLMTEMNDAGKYLTEEMGEKAIIAAFFHDIGLVRTLDESHGLAGKEMCLEYFRTRDLPLPEGIEEILQAIEKHDDKGDRTDLKNTAGKETGDTGTSAAKPDLLSMLSTCDDLDAFGHIGIYRYTEIYLLRGVSETALASKVLSNLENRYRNLLHRYHYLTRFISGQEERYALIRDFYASGSSLQVLSFIKRTMGLQRSLLEPELLISIQDEHHSIQDFIRNVHRENALFPYP